MAQSRGQPAGPTRARVRIMDKFMSGVAVTIQLSSIELLDSLLPLLLHMLRVLIQLSPRQDVRRLCLLLDTATCASVILPWFLSTYLEVGESPPSSELN